MEIRAGRTIVSDYDRVKQGIRTAAENNIHSLDNKLQKKMKNLEFLLNELTTRKENLMHDVNVIDSIKSRVEQTIKSYQYPKDICLKCFEMRKTVSDLCSDEVQKDLRTEIQLIENTWKFFDSLLDELKEQLRKDKSMIYGLEEDILQKKRALRIEKQNGNLKTSDSEIFSDRQNVYETIKTAESLPSRRNWLYDTEKLLKSAKHEYENGQKLKLLIEESLCLKTAELISHHDRCDEKFSKSIAHHKDKKNSLENHLSKVNEQIPRLKLTIREIENEINENELRIRLASIRLTNRTESSCAELSKDDVESALIKELKDLDQVTSLLQQRRFKAHSSLSSLNKLKNQYKTEIDVKINAIKIDEVECLPLRSSIHYHAY